MQLRQPNNLRQPLQMTAHALRPVLNLPFAARGTASIGPYAITYTGNNGTLFNSAGTLTAATTNVPRIDYNPASLICRGLLIEESRTNSIRNNTMVGASAGTPGTLPTNWATFTVLTGLTRTIVGTGTENGIAYIDIRLSGTPSAAGSYYLQFESNTQVAASNGQAWTSSSYFKLVAGSLTGITLTLVTSQRDGVGGDLGGVSTAFTPSSAGLSTQRIQSTLTNNSASTAFELPYIQFTLSGVAIDITLRIGLPQLELGAFATSVIQTSGAAVTRAADIASMTGSNFSSWYNQTQGTFVLSGNITETSLVNKAIISVSDGTANNRTLTRYQNTAGLIASVFRSGAVSVAQLDSTVAPSTSIRKMALAYANNDFSQSVNAETPVTDSAGAVPASVNQIQIGSIIGGTEFLNGWIQSIAYYPQRLPNSMLQNLTL